MKLSDTMTNVNRVNWSPLNEQVWAACSDGTIRIFDAVKGIESEKIIFDPNYEHKAATLKSISRDLTAIKYCHDLSSVIISSRNTEAKIYDIKDWSVVAEYKTDRGLNGASLHPKCDAMIIGGGMEAVDAALERKEGRYECLVYHKVFEERMGMIPVDSISPLTAMEFSPDGSCAALGYVEGQVRIYRFGNEFSTRFEQMERRFTAEIGDEESDEE
jgi:WD40 repeat protein